MHPNGKHNWRATAWEIHPLTNIQITGDPPVNPLNQIFRRDLMIRPQKQSRGCGVLALGLKAIFFANQA
jgi:hypothetical protein